MEYYRMKIATISLDDEENQLFRGEEVKILDQRIERKEPLKKILLYVRPNVRPGEPRWITKCSVKDITPDPQEIIGRAVRHLGLSIGCEVRRYRDGKYPTDFFQKKIS